MTRERGSGRKTTEGEGGVMWIARRCEDGRIVRYTQESDGSTCVTRAEHKGSTPTEYIVNPMDPDESRF